MRSAEFPPSHPHVGTRWSRLFLTIHYTEIFNEILEYLLSPVAKLGFASPHEGDQRITPFDGLPPMQRRGNNPGCGSGNAPLS